jgi:hypothetical protein
MQHAPSNLIANRLIIVPGVFQHLDVPRSTPWGPPQECDRIMWGAADDGSRVPILWQVHTSGHGGTRVHKDLAARFLNGLPKECHAFGGSRLWFEEDAESTVPLFIFYNGLAPDCWLVRADKPFPREQLMDSIRRWMPEAAYAVRRLAAAFDKALGNAGIALRTQLAD